MFQLKRQTPTPNSKNVALGVYSRSAWFGRRFLRMGGLTLYLWGRFAGIEQRFSIPDSGHAIRLRLMPISGTPNWRPAFFGGDAERPEQTTTEPPQLAERSKVLGVPVGIAYLCILIAVVLISARSGLNRFPIRRQEASIG